MPSGPIQQHHLRRRSHHRAPTLRLSQRRRYQHNGITSVVATTITLSPPSRNTATTSGPVPLPTIIPLKFRFKSKRNVFLEQPCLWNKGIFFIAIDVNKPHSDQGPFDVVLHK
ncbi:inositol-tetrakisphosphate 1-kinase 3-like isoform X2 [Malus domestica]